MFGSEVLDVAIGLVLVYLLLALICSALSEWVARMLALRAKTLEAGVRNLLHDKNGTGLAQDIYCHPLVEALYKGGGVHKGRPSNIPARTFARAFFDTVMEAGPPSVAKTDFFDRSGRSRALQKNAMETFKALERKVEAIPDAQVKRAMKSILASAKAESDQWDKALARARTSVEDWFDDSMERVSGWYKRKTQLIVLALAVVVSGGLNIDTFVIGNVLSTDATLRASVVAAAEARAKQTPTVETLASSSVPALREELKQLGLPMGWSWSSEEDNDPRKAPDDALGWLLKVAGVLFTAFAVALGAPFWFDLLNKFVDLRGGGGRPQKAAEARLDGAGAPSGGPPSVS